MLSGAELPVLDLDHLSRQTADDDALQRELLVLFDRQCVRLLPRILDGGASGRERDDAAHLLTGAARAVGATRVAALSAAIEAEPGEAGRLATELQTAVAELRAVLAARLALT